MPQIANISGSPVLYRDEDGELAEILPGTAAEVKISKDHPKIVADVSAGLIEFGGTKAHAAKTAREKAPVDPVEPTE